MNSTITIENCNNIKHAEISVIPNAINIKYGYNGTGKTTIGKAIKAKADGSDNNLKALQPYGESVDPAVGNLPYKKIMVFNEEYVQKYLFNNNATFDDSYSVLIRTDETEELSQKISTHLSSLHNLKVSEKSILEIHQFLERYINTVTLSNTGIAKRGGVGEIIKGNGFGFDNHPELHAYKPYYSRSFSDVGVWAKWRTEGSKLLASENICPFCTHDIDLPAINKQNKTIERVFKASALKTAQAILDYLHDGVSVGYIASSSISSLENYLGDESKSAEIESEIARLAAETHYLAVKIQQILSFAPMNVTKDQLTNIEETLKTMKIETKQLSYFYNTAAIEELALKINDRIDQLLSSTGQLRGLFNQHEKKIESVIKNREDDINDFLSLAGFPYKFEIQKQGEKKASTKLVPIDHRDIDIKAKSNLSWGEKNSFSLVLFMFEAISESADLIVLDDPISSFDVNKKFAVMTRLLDKKKEASFYKKTVLILTHDIQPIIDFIRTNHFLPAGYTANATFLTNDHGVIQEKEIEERDLLNTVVLSERLAKDSSLSLPVRVINYRKYIELSVSNYRDSALYHLLSNLVHGRQHPTYSDKTTLLETKVIDEGMEKLKPVFGYENYGGFLLDLSTDVLFKTAESSDMYSRIVSIRFLFERKDGLLKQLKQKYPASAKFLNETNHVENDYVFQLDPCKFFEIPPRYLDEITNFLHENKTKILKS